MNAQTAIAEIRASYAKRIDQLETALASNKPGAMIYAWSQYGIGVRIEQEGPRVVGVDLATVVRASDRRAFTNGSNVPAALMDRATALRAALVITRNVLSTVERNAA